MPCMEIIQNGSFRAGAQKRDSEGQDHYKLQEKIVNYPGRHELV